MLIIGIIGMIVAVAMMIGGLLFAFCWIPDDSSTATFVAHIVIGFILVALALYVFIQMAYLI